ncbi:MAG: sulfite exporter TauE/SafE family protein, partial [Rhodospirillaceae bacterium]|nr:sulfite exporter TauE/SafE family protein [Rhodospirillaceae bacterium]
GFLLVPAMIYLLGIPVSVVIGTSLFQITFVTAVATILHASNTQTVDVLLAGLLTLGAVIGAQFGTRVGAELRGEELRGLLALVVLGVCATLLWRLVTEPTNLFSLSVMGLH